MKAGATRDVAQQVAAQFDDAVLIDVGAGNIFDEIRKATSKGMRQFDESHIIDHGGIGRQNLGGSSLRSGHPFWDVIASTVRPDGLVACYACNMAQGDMGRDEVMRIGKQMGRRIRADASENRFYRRWPWLRRAKHKWGAVFDYDPRNASSEEACK